MEEDATDAEMARSSYGAPDASTPILDRFMPFLRANKGWSK